MLQNLHQVWEKYNLKRVFLFGSYARLEQTSSSDIDFLIEHSTAFSLFDLINLQMEIEKIVQTEVDIVFQSSVSKFLKESINRDKILIYSK